MALGGGTFTTMNKKLPGTYINFISTARAASLISERGVAAIGVALDWGADGEIVAVSNSDFEKNALKLFGYEYTNDKLKGLRDLFINVRLAYIYKLNSATTGIAANDFATAKCAGSRGNAIKIKIAANVDDATKWDVSTIFDELTVDTQTVASAAALVANDYVTFKANATLEATAGTALTGGVSAAVVAANHQTFLEKIEPYTFDAIGAVSDETASGSVQVNALYASFCRRMRDQLGVKFQAVLFRHAADYEGVVNVKNAVTDANVSAASLVYWVLGVVAATPISESALNDRYDGEFTVNVDYTQDQLEAAMDAGEFTLHRVGDEIRVLNDQNSLVTLTPEKGELFRENQTIRVIDAIANYIASLFNRKYLGQIPNNQSGRVSLWADVVQYMKQLQDMGAIEAFDENTVTVEQGNTKRSVVVNCAVTVINAMAQLYMTCVVD